MKKRTLISTTAGLAVAAMLMGAGFVGTANADEIANNDITITQPQSSAVSNLIQPTVNGRTFKAYRISDYSNAQVSLGHLVATGIPKTLFSAVFTSLFLRL